MQTCQPGVAGPAARSEIERRVSPSALRWPERRTGFDRRAPQPITKALRDNLPVLVGLVVVLNVLNLVDFALTSRALAYGAAEANPIMNAIFLSGWENAALFKLGTMLASLARDPLVPAVSHGAAGRRGRGRAVRGGRPLPPRGNRRSRLDASVSRQPLDVLAEYLASNGDLSHDGIVARAALTRAPRDDTVDVDGFECRIAKGWMVRGELSGREVLQRATLLLEIENDASHDLVRLPERRSPCRRGSQPDPWQP